tara:strand:+ start:914 stop:1186 length:273 start_codon:yes stop_codon:yes gene_type:complete
MENTFDINSFDKEQLESPASFKQCRALSFKFAKKADGSMNWIAHKQVQGCLFGLAKEGKFNFKQANELFSKKALPKKYKDSISLYLKENS